MSYGMIPQDSVAFSFTTCMGTMMPHANNSFTISFPVLTSLLPRLTTQMTPTAGKTPPGKPCRCYRRDLPEKRPCFF